MLFHLCRVIKDPPFYSNISRFRESLCTYRDRQIDGLISKTSYEIPFMKFATIKALILSPFLILKLLHNSRSTTDNICKRQTNSRTYYILFQSNILRYDSYKNTLTSDSISWNVQIRTPGLQTECEET